MFRRIVPVLGLALGLGLASQAAMAQEQSPPPPPAVQGTPGKDFTGVSPANLADITKNTAENNNISHKKNKTRPYTRREKNKTTQNTRAKTDNTRAHRRLFRQQRQALLPRGLHERRRSPRRLSRRRQGRTADALKPFPQGQDLQKLPLPHGTGSFFYVCFPPPGMTSPHSALGRGSGRR
nr:the smallest subunit precursor of membrane-bound alcohol dehydrogenase [Gluconobacter oxydans]